MMIKTKLNDAKLFNFISIQRVRSVRSLANLWILLCAAMFSLAAPLHAGAPMEITVCDDLRVTSEALPRLKLFKEMGATSIQTYIYWKDIERTPDVYTWDVYDAYLAAVREAGLKWVPFVVAGPWYLTPEFERSADETTFARCLEHGKDSKIPSIWDPAFKLRIKKYLQAFSDHYNDSGILESVNLGITGDYGESIFQVIGNFPGSYHTHPGMWCGDAHAVADFQAAARQHYAENIEQLNAEWNTHYASFETLQPFDRLHAPSPQAWLFLGKWYRDAMTAYSDWWLASAREIFGETPLYLCTGGDMAIQHGSDFAAQSKAAAKYKAGIRITNENSSLPANVYLTRLVASATRYYGGFCGFEPASAVTPVGTLGRLFNAYTSGARQLFIYASNLLDGETPNAALRLIKDHSAYMQQAQPQNEIAVFYGNTDSILNSVKGDLFYRLRDALDYDFVDETMLLDGALDRYKVLIVNELTWIPDDVVAGMSAWVEAGGTLIAFKTRAKNVHEQTDVWDALVGLNAQSEETVGICLSKMRLLDAQALPSFTQADQWIVMTAMGGLSADCTPLLRMAEPLGGVNVWRRSVGSGRVIAYWGPMNFGSSEAEWNQLPPLPGLFLKDAINYLQQQKLIKDVPRELWANEHTFYFATMQSGEWVAVNMDDNHAAEFDWNGTKFKFPAQSITTLTLPE